MSRWAASALFVCVTACGGSEPIEPNTSVREAFDHLPYAQSIHALDLGPGSGYGAEFVEVVLGPPRPSTAPTQGSLDVLSLGDGGSIVLAFGERMITDGPGDDFVVFENAFFIDGDESQPFEELGIVSVSTDAVSWHTFDCSEHDKSAPWPGCAGWQPTLPFDTTAEDLRGHDTGGDRFDLADLGLTEAKYVRIKDCAGGAEPTAGFDLDAVGILNPL